MQFMPVVLDSVAHSQKLVNVWETLQILWQHHGFICSTKKSKQAETRKREALAFLL